MWAKWLKESTFRVDPSTCAIVPQEASDPLTPSERTGLMLKELQIQSLWHAGNANKAKSVRGVRLRDNRAPIHRLFCRTAVANAGSEGKSRESKTWRGDSSPGRLPGLQPRSFLRRTPGPVRYLAPQRASGSLEAAGPARPQLCSAGFPAHSFKLRFLREAAPLNLTSQERLGERGDWNRAAYPEVRQKTPAPQLPRGEGEQWFRWPSVTHGTELALPFSLQISS